MPPPTTTTSKGWSWTAWSASLREITVSLRGPRSLEELDHLVGGQALGRALLLHRRAEVEQTDEALVVGDADGGAAFRGAENLRRAPVARETSPVRGEHDDVRGACGRVEVLLVLGLVAGQRAGDDDKRRSALELGRRLRARGLLQALQGVWPEHPESPGIGEVVVRRPARQVEDLLELLPIDRRGPVRLMGPPGADRLLDVHRGQAS